MLFKSIQTLHFLHVCMQQGFVIRPSQILKSREVRGESIEMNFEEWRGKREVRGIMGAKVT